MVKTAEVIQGRKFIYYIPPTSFVEGQGHRVSIVVKDESGHFPSGGGDVAPWYWGDKNDCSKSFKEATALAEEMNEKRGISRDEQLEILSSSMCLSTRGQK